MPMPAKSRKPRTPRPTAAELDLLRVIWRLGPATVREVHQAQLRERPGLAYATLEAGGFRPLMLLLGGLALLAALLMGFVRER